MKILSCFFLTGLIIVWSAPCAAERQVAPPYCDPEYFENENSMENPPPLKEFLESLTNLKIYSTSDFFTVKREEGLPDGIPSKPLRAYPELQGKWSNLWDKFHAFLRARGEKIEKRKKPSVGELHAFIMKMVSEEDIPKKEFPEENVNSQEEREQEISPLTTGRSLNNQSQTKGKPPTKTKTYNDEYQETPQRITETVRYNSQEERKERILALITENDKITQYEMAEKMGLSKTTIVRMIFQLKEEGRLIRIGFSSDGYWKILREGDTPDHYDSPEERKENTPGIDN